jgi:hypothetical protein
MNLCLSHRNSYQEIKDESENLGTHLCWIKRSITAMTALVVMIFLIIRKLQFEDFPIFMQSNPSLRSSSKHQPSCRKGTFITSLKLENNDSNIFIFGGSGGHTRFQFGRGLTDLWEVNLKNGWNKKKTTTNPNHGIYNGCSASSEDGFFIFGGSYGGISVANELWFYNYHNNEWALLFPPNLELASYETYRNVNMTEAVLNHVAHRKYTLETSSLPILSSQYPLPINNEREDDDINENTTDDFSSPNDSFFKGDSFNESIFWSNHEPVLYARYGRKSPGCVYHNHQFFAFGGKNNDLDEVNNIIIFNILTELNEITSKAKNNISSSSTPNVIIPAIIQPSIASVAPSSRKGSCAEKWIDSETGKTYMMVFGGRTGIKYYPGFWKLDITNVTQDPNLLHWENLTPDIINFSGNGSMPRARDHHTCQIIANRFYMFGGRYGRETWKLLNDFWYYDLKESNQWYEIKQPSSLNSEEEKEKQEWPVPRYLTAMRSSASSQNNDNTNDNNTNILLFGGETLNQTRLNDLWVFSIQNETFKEIIPSSCL